MNQKKSRINPVAPVTTKAHRQPNAAAIKGTVNGATIAPILLPELNIPVASARSLIGNHSATVFMAAGKFPASVTPSPTLARRKPSVDLTSAWPDAAILQKNITSAYPHLDPILSITLPITTMPNA